MDVVIAVEHRFVRTPDGAVWTTTGLARPHWSRYLGTFRRVHVLARVLDAAEPPAEARRTDGDGVDVLAVPHFVGPRAYLRSRGEVADAVAAALAAHPDAAVLLRVPGTIGKVARFALAGAGRPYGVEVVGDPWDVFSRGAVRHPLRPALRVLLARELRAVCARACAALYVTSAALQRRYPTGPRAAAFAASDVELGDDAYADAPRPAWPPGGGRRLRVVTVGTLQELYKAPDVLVEAAAHAWRAGIDLELHVVGGGKYRPALQGLAARLGIADRVRFLGSLPAGEPVRRELDGADLFALSSRAEGMPRALVEAMARGLPCLATPVGGIPEVLPPEALAPPEPRAFGARLVELASDAPLRAALARANLARAAAFHERALQPVREAFQRHLAAEAARRASAPAARRTAWA